MFSHEDLASRLKLACKHPAVNVFDWLLKLTHTTTLVTN